MPNELMKTLTIGANTYDLPQKTSDLTNDSGFLTDDKTWNGVELAKQQTTNSGDSTYTLLASSTSPVNMSFTPIKKTPTSNAIAKYDSSAYLYSTTPSASDNSTKVATTAYVDNSVSNLSIPTKTSDLTNDSGFTTNTGTVTSVRVQATSPVQSSTNTAQSATLNTTISLADGYGDTKNPYASKTKNYVLAAPSTANGVPSFRALVADDIPSLTKSKISDFPTIPTKTSDLTNDSGYLTSAVTSFNGSTGAVTYTAPVTSVNGNTGAVTGLQTTSNLVTSVSSSSTNAQYPSAKLFYDTVGNVETLLASI